MNLAQIEVIVAIAQAGSISQAAQNLYISQPAISKLLQKFEEEVGAQIFERVSTGVRLTPLGRRFIEQSQDIIDQVGRLEELFTKRSALTSMELNVASMSYHFMQRVLSELYIHYNYSPIHIKYVECGFDSQVDRIGRDEVEIGLVTLWQNDLKKMIKKAMAKGVEYHRLGAAALYIGVSRGSQLYPDSVKGLDFERLSRMPIVSISPSSPSKGTGWDFTQQIFKNVIKTSNQEITTTNTGTMREMVKQIDGFSLILLNEGIYKRYCFFDDIRIIPCENEKQQFEMGWLQRANSVRSPLASELRDILAEYCT